MFCKNCGQILKKREKFCKGCGAENIRPLILTRLGGWFQGNRRPLIILACIFIAFTCLVYWADSSDNSYSYDTSYSERYGGEDTAEKGVTLRNQHDITASVVNIICGSKGGSGTILTNDGMILTNAHIVPQNNIGEPTTKLCLITLPDTQGKVKEIYYGRPILITDLSNEYDLGFIEIEGVYEDEDGETYGRYPNEFPGFITEGCVNDEPQLGEAVRVYGYPSISGEGYYLTVTDGVVSSIPNDGTILTSAKIEHGNSGGLAVDGDGCMLGVPAMVSRGQYESLGVIITNDVIYEFINKINE